MQLLKNDFYLGHFSRKMFQLIKTLFSKIYLVYKDLSILQSQLLKSSLTVYAPVNLLQLLSSVIQDERAKMCFFFREKILVSKKKGLEKEKDGKFFIVSLKHQRNGYDYFL